jgi:hypothetical protein
MKAQALAQISCLKLCESLEDYNHHENASFFSPATTSSSSDKRKTHRGCEKEIYSIESLSDNSNAALN